MTDTPDPETGAETAPDSTPSWEDQLEDAARDQTRPRRNGFDAARKKTFLKTLSKGATLTEAAKAACVSKSTLYAHQKEDERFAAACRAAAEVNAPVIELAAFERGVTGVEEDVISYGKHVGTRVKRSDAILQTLLKGSNPDKYGAQAGFKHKFGKKKWREKERARLRAEILAELDAEREEPSEEQLEELRARLARRIKRWGQQVIEEDLANGYTQHAETNTLVPPGWVLVRTGNEHSGCPERPIPECPESGGMPR